jgi:radical SAM superfamily enzyme YgiQ (UPF0313 family)
MPHVALVTFAGFRVRQGEMAELGMTLPGLSARRNALAQLPALGLLTLAGMTPPEWTCSYHAVEGDSAGLLDEVMVHQPALVAISALTASALAAYAFAEKLKRRAVPTAIGGLHATACPAEARRHCSSVIVGDGEPIWRRVLADALTGRLQPEYRSGPFDLGQAPVPRYELVAGRPLSRLTLQTQRGCPLACEFCAASRLLGPLREKPIENIQRELAGLAQVMSRPVIELADDNTFVGRRDPAPLFEALGAARVKYFTEVDWRVARRPEVLAGLAASGCVQVLVGIESLARSYAGMGPKGEPFAAVLEEVEAIQSAGVAVNGCFIVGADGETQATVAQLRDAILGSNLADVQLTLQTPYPGTALHRRLKDAGRLLPARDWSHYTLFDVTYIPDCMSVVELERTFRELVQEVYCASETRRRAEIRKRIYRGRRDGDSCNYAR